MSLFYSMDPKHGHSLRNLKRDWMGHIPDFWWECRKSLGKVIPPRPTSITLSPPVSSLVQTRRVRFAGHCCRADQEVISDLLLWKPNSQNKRGRKLTYPDVISRDVGLKQEDLKTAMMDREVWRSYVEAIVSTTVEQWWWCIAYYTPIFAAIPSHTDDKKNLFLCQHLLWSSDLL